MVFSLFLSNQFINELYPHKKTPEKILTQNEIRNQSKQKILNTNKTIISSDSINVDQKENANFSKNIKLVNDK